MTNRIIDMNTDCIEHIFTLLNFPDLLNTAESNETLHFVACQVIARKYRNQNLTLILEGSQFLWQQHNDFQIKNGNIHVFNFHVGLKILRYFGCVCKKIYINYCQMNLKQRKTIEYYLSEYCADESLLLTNIVLEDCPEDALHYIHNPLRSVQKVVITGDCNSNFEHLNKTFPNMNWLSLTWLQIPNGNCIERRFNALKRFEVEVRDRIEYFTEINVQNAVKLNPQLDCVIVKLFKHPDLDEKGIIEFLGQSFETPEKMAFVVPPNV